MFPTITLVTLSVIHSQLESFKTQTFLIWLFYSYVYALSILKLMIANMTQNQKFSVFNRELLYPVIVILVSKFGNLTLDQEVLLLRVAVAYTLLHAVYIFTVLSVQIDTTLKRNFWFLKSEKKTE